MVDCPKLIAQMHEKGVLQPTPTQNVQMTRSEPREEDPSVNMVLRSSATTGGDARKKSGKDEKGHSALTKEPEQVKGMIREASESFMTVSTLGDRDPNEPRMDPSMLTTFLETCMNLIRNNRAVKGL